MRTIGIALSIMLVAAIASVAVEKPFYDANAAAQAYRDGIAAADTNDLAVYESRMRVALESAPDQPVIMFHLARALALQGHSGEAVKWLARVAATGADPGIETDEAFRPIRGRDDFKAVVADVAAHKTPIGRPETAFELEAGDMLPEGIAWNPIDAVFYISSVRNREIVSVGRGLSPERFAAPDDMYGALGLFVDTERRDLWSVSSMMPGVKGFSAATDGDAAVHRFDTWDGNVEGVYTLRNDTGVHNFADITVSSAGVAYITDSAQGTIYMIDPEGDDRLIELIGPGELRGPQGITLSDDEQLLYVSQYAWGIVVIDLETNAWAPLPHPEDVVACGIDGLYFHNGALVGIQNYAGLSQVSRFQLAGDGRSIVSASIVCRHDEHMDDPTTGAFDGDEFYFVANSQLPRVEEDGTVPPSDTFDDTFILSIKVE